MTETDDDYYECPECQGKGEKTTTCWRCHGLGRTSDDSWCFICSGRGKLTKECNYCQGTGEVTEDELERIFEMYRRRRLVAWLVLFPLIIFLAGYGIFSNLPNSDKTSPITPFPTISIPPEKTAKIISNGLYVRTGPGVEYPTITWLEQGAIVPILSVDPQSGWLQIQLSNGKIGWISGHPDYVVLQ